MNKPTYEELAAMLKVIGERFVNAGKDSTEQDMVKLRKALVIQAGELAAAATGTTFNRI